MTTQDMIKMLQKTGVKISKESLLEAVRKSPQKEFELQKDKDSVYSVVQIALEQT